MQSLAFSLARLCILIILLIIGRFVKLPKCLSNGYTLLSFNVIRQHVCPIRPRIRLLLIRSINSHVTNQRPIILNVIRFPSFVGRYYMSDCHSRQFAECRPCDEPRIVRSTCVDRLTDEYFDTTNN